MLTERDIELAHPDAFDFAFGNLPEVKQAEFTHHLSSCPHCQKVLDEYSDIGRIIKNLPLHVEPPADLEDRTVAAMVAALAEQRATTDRRPDTEDQVVTRLYPRPERQQLPEPETRVQPIPQFQPPAGDETELRPSPAGPSASAEPQAPPVVKRLPVWRRYRGRLAAVVTVAAAIIAAAIVVPLSLGGGRLTPAQAAVVIPLHATTAAKVSGFGAATGQATARQDASGSWDITLTVHHLRNFGDAKWYQCWYVSTQRGQVASAGTFLVPDNGSGTFSMTSAVDPHDFSAMEITVGPPNTDGALAGTVILNGQPL
jgi:Anti-sigma-K factor rskA